MTRYTETFESVTSYSVASLTAFVALLSDLEKPAQHLTVILALFVVILRLIHDSLNLYRVWKNGKKHKGNKKQ